MTALIEKTDRVPAIWELSKQRPGQEKQGLGGVIGGPSTRLLAVGSTKSFPVCLHGLSIGLLPPSIFWHVPLPYLFLISSPQHARNTGDWVMVLLTYMRSSMLRCSRPFCVRTEAGDHRYPFACAYMHRQAHGLQIRPCGIRDPSHDSTHSVQPRYGQP